MSERIAYGSTYSPQLRAIIGDTPRVIDTCAYLRPTYTTYIMPDRRIAQVIDQPASALVIIHETLDDYRAACNARYDRDPETGR